MLKGRLGLETARVPQTDRHGVLWLSRGNLFVEDGTLQWVTAGDDELEAGSYSIPFQMLSCVLLQPGSTITHDALRLLARHGTGLVAVGDGAVRHYASMPFGPDESARARRQAAMWADPKQRVFLARKMYAWRLGEAPEGVTDIDALRGIEGARMKKTYSLLAQKFGLAWRGRRYDRAAPDATDIANQVINHVVTVAYAAANVAVSITGAIPQLGFIHEDSGVSFALDVADLFRDSFTLPVAFNVAQSWEAGRGSVERSARKFAGAEVRRQKLVASMIDRIKELLDGDDDRRHARGG